MDYALAFYRGRRRILDRAIQVFTRSPFSHVELIRFEGELAHVLSASGMDGGVRTKTIVLDQENWVIVPAGPWARADAWALAAAHLGAPYDHLGVLLSQIIGSRRQSRRAWFCSELVAHALGLARPESLSPGDLYVRVLELNRASRGLLLAA